MGIQNVMITVGARTADAVAGFERLNRAVGDSMTRSQKWGAAMKRAAIPAGIALSGMAVAGLAAARAAASDEAAQVKLAGQLTRTTKASSDAIARNEEWISSLSQATGVADDELRPALGKLASATHDLGKGQDALKLALDLSAQSGKPLELTSKALAAAFDGKTKALAKLVPGLNQATLKGGDMGKIMAELGRKTGGAAAEAANTAEGRFRRLTVSLQETKESIGAALLPVLEKLLAIIQPVVSWLQRHSTIAVALGVAVAGVAAAVLVVNAAMSAWSAITKAVAAVQLVLNAALSANPIGIVVVAIAGLVAGLVLAYQHSESFRGVVETLLGWLKSLWAFLKPIASTAFDGLKLAFEALSAPARILWQALEYVKDHAEPVVKFLKGIASGVFAGIAKAFSLLATPVNLVVAAIEKLQSLWAWVKRNVQGTGGIDWANPGGGAGIVNPGPRFASLGRARSLGGYAFAGTIPQPAGGGITVNVSGAIDPEGTARAIRQVLEAHDRRQGRA